MSKALVKPKTDLPAVHLPDVSALSSPLLKQLTTALGVPRDVLADDDQIEHAWRSACSSCRGRTECLRPRRPPSWRPSSRPAHVG